ncbi:hypothetical protein F2Q69_00001534 [Brassica cretica]|uniref:RNase H type-1 domain-containing protein n=1 Tax=Brassica cretica TaxID=69181 RepID=A0A8S9NN85_BRACR|nr:hypothetical protein F2Q69_00001534 [Brassica cretica]
MKPANISPLTVVIQTDAVWNGTTKNVGLGWIIKKTEGFLRFQESNRLVNSPLVAEGLAMRKAVEMCKEPGIQYVSFESDSSQLIKALNSMVEPPEIYGIIADIRIACNFFTSVSFVWIPRAGNSEADLLAKQALNLVSSGFAV